MAIFTSHAYKTTITDQLMTQPSDAIVEQEDIALGFGPNDGGDFTLRSHDGVDFCIHSQIIRRASPVFEDLVSIGSGEPIVTLTEDARTIRLLLRFIYCFQELPAINDYASLEKSLEIARKYEVTAMTSLLRSMFWLQTSQLHMRKDPIAAYELACEFGFEDIQKACYQHCIRSINLSDDRTITDILPLCRHPRYVLPLIARLAKRRAIITETLHAIYAFPMNLLSSQWDTTHIIRETLAQRLMCETCLKAYSETVHSTVSWQMFWVDRACQVLVRRPMDECTHVFEVGFLCKPYDEDEEVTVFCEECFTHIQLKNHKTWENWAQIVRETLEAKLGDHL